MAARTKQQALRAGPALWGQRRAESGISLRALETATGIYRGDLSKMERGRLFPTAEEFRLVLEALDRLKGEGS
jgi:transcriptional regulator with XRE-family HTH domain